MILLLWLFGFITIIGLCLYLIIKTLLKMEVKKEKPDMPISEYREYILKERKKE